MKVIVFTNDVGIVAVTTPADCGLPIDEIARMSTPPIVVERDKNGVPTKTEPRPYLIIDDSELPDRELRDRWVLKTSEVVIE